MSVEDQKIEMQGLAQMLRRYDERIERGLEYQEGLGSTVIELISSAIASSGRGRPDVQSSLRKSLIEAVYDTAEQSGAQDTAAANFKISKEHRDSLERKFVSKLHYGGMEQREQTVAEAHENTFRWIFESPGSRRQASDELSEDHGGLKYTWDDFRAWLESDEPLYWITGKAGSGKSTLMKFVSMELDTAAPKNFLKPSKTRRCNEYLLHWAKDQPLVVVTFYFWAGTVDQMQTSKQGLYRTLLSQILEACPEAIPYAAPARWETLCLFNVDTRPLTVTDLQEMLVRAVQYVSSRMKLCFFIDGLDEFKGKIKDLKELVDWVKVLINTGPVKICVASRPWVVFEDALDGKPNLLLENLTQSDINDFVTSKFRADAEFKTLQQREPDFADQLIAEIVRKATGVFLWVNLVCSSLIDGMMAGDRIIDLRKRLDLLPSDLETLYDRILDNLDPFYHEHAARYFFLMRASSQTPEALLFSFADDADEDPESPFKMQKGLLSGADIQYRVRQMRKRLNTCCRGLIGVPKFGDDASARFLREATVEYLHRTARDYLDQENTQQKVLGMLKEPFDPYVRLCSASLAMWKGHTADLEAGHDVLESHQKVFECLRNAANVSPENKWLMLRLVEELKLSMHTKDDGMVFANIRSLGSGSHTFLPLLERSCLGNTFLSLAIKFDVIAYVRGQVKGQQPGCVIASRQPIVPPRLSHRQSKPRGAKGSWRAVFKRSRRVSTQVEATIQEVDDANSGSPIDDVLVEWPLLLDALFSNTSPNPVMVSLLLESRADPNLATGGGEVRSTIWMEVLAYFIALNAQNVSSSHSWNEVIRFMVRHGANIERRTIDQVLRVVVEVYRIPPSQHGLTVDGLQKLFRAQKFAQDRTAPELTLENARPTGRVPSNIAYNPYNTMQVRRQMRRVR